MVPPDLQVSDHTSIDKALAVLTGSHTDQVLVRDDTGRCAGVATRDQIAAHCARPWYAQNTRVRDITHDSSPSARCGMSAADAAAGMRERSLATWPVGVAVGVLTTTRLRAVLDPSAGSAAAST